MTHTIMVNPGSGELPTAGEGWTNTPAQARVNAEEWLAKMRAEGIGDVELLDGQTDDGWGRWTFTFRHTVTGVTVRLDIHGISDNDMAAFQKICIFSPRVYWNGSSSSNPDLSDFAAPGFTATYRPTAEGTETA